MGANHLEQTNALFRKNLVIQVMFLDLPFLLGMFCVELYQQNYALLKEKKPESFVLAWTIHYERASYTKIL